MAQVRQATSNFTPRQVTEILSATELMGRVMSTHKLGQRKNCNLPGVVSDLPVLGEQDVDDVQNFACWCAPRVGAQRRGTALQACFAGVGIPQPAADVHSPPHFDSHNMDFIFASFVQQAEDVRFIREVRAPSQEQSWQCHLRSAAAAVAA